METSGNIGLIYKFKNDNEERELMNHLDSLGFKMISRLPYSEYIFTNYGDIKLYYGVGNSLTINSSFQQVTCHSIESFKTLTKMIIEQHKPTKNNNIKSETNMKNQVIEVLNAEHGKKVIEYWKNKGVDTTGFAGFCTKEDKIDLRFYGIINNVFNNYNLDDVKIHNAEIITLPEEIDLEDNIFEYPKVMLVSNNRCTWIKRVVFTKKCNYYIAWDTAETLEESETVTSTTCWNYAKDISIIQEFTKQEIADKLGINADEFIIKD